MNSTCTYLATGDVSCGAPPPWQRADVERRLASAQAKPQQPKQPNQQPKQQPQQPKQQPKQTQHSYVDVAESQQMQINDAVMRYETDPRAKPFTATPWQ
jgi:hypothetical protein